MRQICKKCKIFRIKQDILKVGYASDAPVESSSLSGRTSVGTENDFSVPKIKLPLTVLSVLCEIISLSISYGPSEKETWLSVEISVSQIFKFILGGIDMILENSVGYCGGREVRTAE